MGRNYKGLFVSNAFGCAFGALIALALVACSLIAFATIVSFGILPNMLKTSISDTTGFRIRNADIKYNIAARTMSVKNIIIENPAKYSSPVFAKISNMTVSASPLSLARGELAISSIEIDLDELNCERISVLDYNLSEFLTAFNRIVSVNGKNLSKVSLKINKASFTDSSTPEKVGWKSNLNFKFEKYDAPSAKDLFKELAYNLSKSNAGYISDAIKAIEN